MSKSPASPRSSASPSGPSCSGGPCREPRFHVLAACLLAPLLAASCRHHGHDGSASASRARDDGEALAGGDTTSFLTSDDAFAQPLANISIEHRDGFAVGNAFFNTNWVEAPASAAGRDGLGPLFNARSCSACHLRDGRGRPPLSPAEPPLALVLKIGVVSPAGDELVPDPAYGGQIQTAANPGVPAEAAVIVEYEEIAGAYSDGTTYSLRRPSYRLESLRYGPVPLSTVLAPIIAPQVFGLGLLATVPEADVVRRADPADADGDGISGRPNRIRDARTGERVLGRFGWKANQPDLEQQAAGAFLGDLGLTTDLFPLEECTEAQSDCRQAASGGTPEVPADILGFVDVYMHTLAPPGRRRWDDPAVRRGRRLFFDIGCDACHTPRLETGPSERFPELADQTIRPYTDLLLHDMGPALADGRPLGAASGSEWRTPPLWGLGLIPAVNGHLFLLHDGRARGFAEAILWHGGEGEASRERFRRLDASDRDDLIRFLEDL